LIDLYPTPKKKMTAHWNFSYRLILTLAVLQCAHAWTPDTNTYGVFIVILIQGIIGVVWYSLFESFRGQKEVFAPKLRSKKERCPKVDVPRTPFGWIAPVLSIDDDEVLSMVGMDGYILLRFLRMCTKVALGFGVVSVVFLVPIYGTGNGNYEEAVVGINRLTMANTVANGDRLWAPFLFSWIFTLGFLYLLYKEYEHFVVLRQQFMVKGDVDLPVQQLYSIVVENVPRKFRSSKRLGELFEELFPGQVVESRIAMNIAPLIKACEERKEFIVALENKVALYEASDRVDTPMLKLKEDGTPVQCCGGSEEVEAIPYLVEQVKKMNDKVAELKQQAARVDADAAASLSAMSQDSDFGGDGDANENAATMHPSHTSGSMDDGDVEVAVAGKNEQQEEEEEEEELPVDNENFTAASIAPTGFVTFKSKCTQATASQVAALSDRYRTMKAFPSPSPQNIIWANTATSLDYIRSSASATRVVYNMGLLFWGLILAFVAAVSSLSNLETFLPFLKSLPAFIYALLESQLPVIMVIVFISLLPMIFTAVSTYIERRKTLHDVGMEVMTWFFSYSLANVYLVLLSGSIFGALSEFLDNPVSVVSLLANSLPGVATFFLNLLLTYLLAGVPMRLLRIGPVLIYKLYLGCFKEAKLTRRTLVEGPLADVQLKYPTEIPKLLYVLCIAMLYWVIAPITFLVCGLLFAANYAVFKYQLLYVIVNKNESGGMYFYKTFNYTMTGFMFASVLNLVYMALKQAFIQAGLMIPLPILIYFAWWRIEDQFKHISLNPTYRQAVRTDKRTDQASLLQSFNDQFFQPPLLSGPAKMLPEVYRIDGTPLVSEKGHLMPPYLASTTVELDQVIENTKTV